MLEAITVYVLWAALSTSDYHVETAEFDSMYRTEKACALASMAIDEGYGFCTQDMIFITSGTEDEQE